MPTRQNSARQTIRPQAIPAAYSGSAQLFPEKFAFS